MGVKYEYDYYLSAMLLNEFFFCCINFIMVVTRWCSLPPFERALCCVWVFIHQDESSLSSDTYM